MPGTVELPLLPGEAIKLSPRLAVVETPEELVFMNASGPLMSCAHSDAAAKRYLGAVFAKLPAVSSLEAYPTPTADPADLIISVAFPAPAQSATAVTRR